MLLTNWMRLSRIAKNNSGTALAWYQKDIASNPTHAKVEAIFLVVLLATWRKWKRVLVEKSASNSLSLVIASNKKWDVPWKVEFIVCIIGLSFEFIDLKFG